MICCTVAQLTISVFARQVRSTALSVSTEEHQHTEVHLAISSFFVNH